MRYLILIILLTFSSFSYSQIGEIKEYGKKIQLGKVERHFADHLTLYTLTYVKKDSIKNVYVLQFTDDDSFKNNDETDFIKSIGFTATQLELDYFYTFLKKGFKENQVRSLKVGECIIRTFPTDSKFLNIYVDYEIGESGTFKVSKRQLAKLFGKK